jgi:hypothetical protein
MTWPGNSASSPDRDRETAQAYYRRSLELDPENANATDMVRWLDRSAVSFAWATLHV